MKNTTLLACAASIAALGTVAQAGNVSYDATSYNSGPGGHSLWFSNGIADLGKDFHFEPSGLFNTDMTTWGQLLGKVVSAADSSNGFNVFFNYDGDTSERTGFKGNGGVINPDVFFLNMIGGTLTGFGDKLAGIALDVTRKPGDGTLATQVGTAANDKNQEFGMSNWFYTVCNTCDNGTVDIFNQVNNRQGDVNLNLAENDNDIVGPIPLPAAGWMLIAGLGGLAAAGRRKKA